MKFRDIDQRSRRSLRGSHQHVRGFGGGEKEKGRIEKKKEEREPPCTMVVKGMLRTRHQSLQQRVALLSPAVTGKGAKRGEESRKKKREGGVTGGRTELTRNLDKQKTSTLTSRSTEKLGEAVGIRDRHRSS